MNHAGPKRQRGCGALGSVFAGAAADDRAALIVYLMAGDPDLDTTAELVREAAHSGADVVELGVPFSDPLADGPTIQRAGQRALRSGTTLDQVLTLVEELRTGPAPVQTPLVLMCYYNPIYSLGPEKFLRRAAKAGADGVIIPDLPVEEALALRPRAEDLGLALINLVAPTTPPERIRMIAGLARGFIYCVSVRGVTGARAALPVDLAEFLGQVRVAAAAPVAVGFGISTPDQVQEVARLCDGVIVGSALVDLVERHSGAELRRAVGGFIGELRRATRRQAFRSPSPPQPMPRGPGPDAPPTSPGARGAGPAAHGAGRWPPVGTSPDSNST